MARCHLMQCHFKYNNFRIEGAPKYPYNSNHLLTTCFVNIMSVDPTIHHYTVYLIRSPFWRLHKALNNNRTMVNDNHIIIYNLGQWHMLGR